MAHPERLAPFEDIAVIGDHASRFGLDPDEVYWKTSFNTVMYFRGEAKERGEYHDRFSYIYSQLKGDDSTRSNTGGKR